MTRKELPSPERLRKLLRYEPETGKLFWRERTPDMFLNSGHGGSRGACARWNGKNADQEAFFSSTTSGYLKGRIGRTSLLAHRVAWAIHHNAWPQNDIDHIDGCKKNNKIGNLRDVPRHINAKNAKMKSNNRSGFNGVFWDKTYSVWVAMIGTPSGNIRLGSFCDKIDAIDARIAAEKNYGYTARHGK